MVRGYDDDEPFPYDGLTVFSSSAAHCATMCYMETVGVRELRQNASALLDRVEHGGVSIEITNHGHPVARLVPIVRHSQASRAQLIDTGVLRPGRGDLLDVQPSHLVQGAPSTADLLAADRDDR